MHVLHVTFDMRIGGTEMVIKSLVEHAEYSNTTMSILCLEQPLGPWGEQLQEKGIPVYSLQRQPGFDYSLIGEIRSLIKAHNVDVLHCHQYTPWVYGAMASVFTKTRVIFTEHGRFYPDSTTWKRRLINPLLRIFTDAFTAISNATKQAVTEFEFIPRERIQVIYNGIKPLNVNRNDKERILNSLGISENTKVLGTLARFDPIKNHTMMLNAFANVKRAHPNTVLVMVGDGDERTAVERTIAELGIKDSVILTGYQSDPKAYLAIMDIFLLSSLSEGTSMTLLEALSLSIPCVVTDAGGNAEVIQHKEVGLVTPNDDSDSFAQAIISLLNNAEEYQRMQNNCSRYFDSRFNASAMCKRFSVLYQEISNNG